ncbi:PASTA domain-containing protein [Nonomuraea sp. NPDC049309]|uniref:PASTA domain-containing protein n=1 Tax=Nonomuraea sp. NPDC049309 TaxID=3364350 RepID=UPI00371ACBA2
MPTAQPLRTGDPRRLGDYELTGRLGEGGQGAVFLGSRGGERYAVKLLHGPVGDERAVFLREVELAKQVARFCTAQVIDAGFDEGRAYIVSEYVDGHSLHREVMLTGPRSGGALERLAVGTATALVAIHRAGIVHRDFKPQNVLLGPDGPRVIDFGLARLLDAAATLSGRGVGTPAYMAPEQITASAVTGAADVFSWGATMCFAANATAPFGQDSVAPVLHRILTAPPELGLLDGRLRTLVAACLEKDARNRPTSRELLFELLGEAPSDVPAEVLRSPPPRILRTPPAAQPLVPEPRAAGEEPEPAGTSPPGEPTSPWGAPPGVPASPLAEPEATGAPDAYHLPPATGRPLDHPAPPGAVDPHAGRFGTSGSSAPWVDHPGTSSTSDPRAGSLGPDPRADHRGTFGTSDPWAATRPQDVARPSDVVRRPYPVRPPDPGTPDRGDADAPADFGAFDPWAAGRDRDFGTSSDPRPAHARPPIAHSGGPPSGDGPPAAGGPSAAGAGSGGARRTDRRGWSRAALAACAALLVTAVVLLVVIVPALTRTPEGRAGPQAGGPLAAPPPTTPSPERKSPTTTTSATTKQTETKRVEGARRPAYDQPSAVRTPTVTVPNLVGLSRAAAAKAVKSAGLAVGRVTKQDSPQAIGQVLSSTPAAGAVVDRGSTVSLRVSAGLPVPSLAGKRRAAAEAALIDAGLKAGSVTRACSEAAEGTVLTTSPKAGSRVKGGTAVALTISRHGAAVPPVVGRPRDAARAALDAAGFTVVTREQPVDDEARAGVVLAQSLAPETCAKPGSQVVITIGELAQTDPDPGESAEQPPPDLPEDD